MTRDDDLRAISDLVHDYCRAVDRLRLDDIVDLYTPDGIDHHTGFSGSAADFVTWLKVQLPALAGTMHMIANHRVELQGDEAVSETYGQAVHWGRQLDDPALNFTSGFRYVDHVVKLDGRWRIRERFAVREWTRSDAGRFRQAEGPGPRGTRDADDPLFALRRKVLDQ